MKKLTIMMGLLLIVLATGVTAFADITYDFNRNNVEVVAYDCLDSGCYSVGSFSGSFPNGRTTSNGELTIVFPSTLASPHGYGLFYFSEGQIPMEYIATWHTNGDNNHYDASFDIDFSQVDVCRSTIDTFTVTNDLYAYEPLVINIDSSLDATTHSAFREASNGIGYVPLAYKDVYYSADTLVTLTIVNSNGNLVYTQEKELSAANGNPLYMSTSRRVEFTWTPTVDDSYTATVTTTVIDNQCASQENSWSDKDFTVLPQRPSDECYTILNNLMTDDDKPVVGTDVEVSYTKLSNYVDDNHQHTAIPTYATYVITDEQGNIVYDSDATLGANVDPYTTSEHTFDWTPDAPGWYDIEVFGIGNSGFCNGKTNIVEEVTEHIYVYDIPGYDLTFQLADAQTGTKIQDASIDIGNAVGTTDSNGMVVFEDLDADTYNYLITASGYQTETGDVDVIDCDMFVYLTLTPGSMGNTAPVLLNIPDIWIVQGSTNSDIDLDDYVIDSESSDAELSWTYSGNSMVGVSIDTAHVITFTAPVNWLGDEIITFTVADPQGASASDMMIVHVTASNTEPEFRISLPDIEMAEDTQMHDAFHLPDFVYDAETPAENLIYEIESVTNANCGVSIGTDLNVDIMPAQDWNGQCDVTISASDGEFTVMDTFTITVTAIPDAPIITSSPILDGIVNVLYVYDVEAYDPDYDPLTYSITTYPAGMTIDEDTGIITWTPDSIGSYPVRVVVTDGIYSDEQLFVIIVTLNGPNQGPTVTITADPMSGHAPLDVQFTADANDPDGSIVSYDWSFGDGSVAFSQNPTHTYTNTGVYIATLTVTDNDMATATASIVIQATQGTAPTVQIVANPTQGTAPLNVDFTSIASDSNGYIVDYQWNFGNGHTATTQHTSHIYTQPGTYTATLTVTDNDGETASDAVIIRVNEPGEGDSQTSSSLKLYKLDVEGNDILHPGDYLRIAIKFENVRDLDLKNLKIQCLVPDLAIWQSIGPIRLDGGEWSTAVLEVQIPYDAEVGLYDYRIAMNDNFVRKVKVRQFEIV